jgi:hypothetical protein
MKKKEFENLSKDELFEKIKAEYARKAKDDFVTGIILSLIWIPIIIWECYSFFTKGDLVSVAYIFILVLPLQRILSSLHAKKIMKAENAEVLLSRYDAYTKKLGKCTKKLGKCLPLIAILALFLIGYMIYNMITQINIERFGAVLFWLIIVFLVLCFLVLCFLFLFMMMILKGNNAKRIGWKDAAIERLRELVNNDQQDTL